MLLRTSKILVKNQTKKILDAINKTIELTDKGSIRVAEKKNKANGS